jgi:hypothetical protein
MPLVTFIVEGRTGNNLFQYMAAKLFSLHYGHTYVPIHELNGENIEILFINDDDMTIALKGKSHEHVQGKNIACVGYFQKSDMFTPYRKVLIETLKTCDDYWCDEKGRKVHIKDFFTASHKQELGPRDVVMSLRLDDFLHINFLGVPGKTSDILPPKYYTDILEKMPRNADESVLGKLYIVSDKLRNDWEENYVKNFDPWSPIMVQDDIMSDFALMRDCPTLIHSNSTLCWIASFFCDKDKTRVIPITYFYKNQSLEKIEDTDTFIVVKPLLHHQVYTGV